MNITHYLVLSYSVYIVGAEFILWYILFFLTIRWWEKLTAHLQQDYAQFYKDNFEISFPFLRSGKDIQMKRNNAYKIVWKGNMPDDLSRLYQNKIKMYAKLTILFLLIPIITVIIFMLKD